MSAVARSDRVLLDVDARGVATVVLNRPTVNNAYDHELIAGLLAALMSSKATRNCGLSFSRVMAAISRPALT